MARVSTKPLSGTRDFLPRELARRNYVSGIIEQVYESHGCLPLETPAMESLDVLLGSYGEDEKLIFKILHRGAPLQQVLQRSGIGETDLSDSALRYDLTVPLARVVAEYGSLPKYFKRYQIQPVWRADRPGKGRFREFYQCDLDMIGSTSLLCEAEVCSAVAEVLGKLGFFGWTLQLNHRQLLRALIRQAGMLPEQETTALVALDKLDKLGRAGVQQEMADRGLPAAAAAGLLDLVTGAEGASPLDFAAELDDPLGKQALQDLAELIELLQATAAAEAVRFSPRLARGLGYYTGPIFEVSVPDLAGSLGGGGRYDELVGRFGKTQVPAVGFSLGFERILVVMEERGMFPELSTAPDLVLCWLDVGKSEVLRVAKQLRDQGLKVEIFPEAAKLGKQLQYASGPGVEAAFAAILGKDELQVGELTLKQLQTGKQAKLAISGVAGHIRELQPQGS